MNQDKFTPEDAKEYLLNWMRRVKEELLNNPEAFQPKEPGFYIGGLKLREGDTIVNDNEGFPCIIRKGCCE